MPPYFMKVPLPDDAEFVRMVRRELIDAQSRAREILGPAAAPRVRLPIPGNRHKTCRVCAGPADDKTPGCNACRTRHYQRARVERADEPRVCKGCRCPLGEKTKGCQACYQRHYHRKQVAKNKHRSYAINWDR